MKKIITVTLSLIVLLQLTLSAQATTSKWIAETKARSLGQNYLKEHSGLSESDYSTYYFVEARKSELSDHTPIWKIQFFGDLDDPRYATNSYIIYVHAYSGAYKGIEYPTVYNPVTAAFNKLRKENAPYFVLWTIQQKYDFKQTFPQIVKAFENLSVTDDTNYLPISDEVLRLLQNDYRLPDENCISQEAAIDLATEALKKAENYTDEYVLSHYHWISSSFLYSYQFSPDGQLVWKIFLMPSYQRGYDLSNCVEITDEIRKEMNEAEDHYDDCGYYVEIDAYNGQTVGIKHQLQSEDRWAVDYE